MHIGQRVLEFFAPSHNSDFAIPKQSIHRDRPQLRASRPEAIISVDQFRHPSRPYSTSVLGGIQLTGQKYYTTHFWIKI